MFNALKSHWPEYLMEAFGLFAFMIGAGLFTTLFDHPDSPVHRAIESPVLRRVGLGSLMVGVTAAIVYSPWGKRSGAHINPSVTWAFFRLGKIAPWDAVFYTVAQFIGAILAPSVLLLVLRSAFTHPDVHYAATQPGPMGVWPAFWGEFVITFILMMTLLIAVNSKRLEKFAGLFASLLVGIYIVVEAPLSGMSMNPARSFGSDFVRQAWPAIWIYFVAPTAATLLAAELYRRLCTGRADSCIKLVHTHDRPCIFCDYHQGATYPVATPEKKES